MPEVFNYLGIYLTQAGNFDAAYEAFDSVLELDPTYNYAHLNRGIALYYGGRDKLAQDDLLAFYQDDPNDPYRSLWLYLDEQKLNEKQAKEALKARFEKSDKEQWGWNIVEFYTGDISEATLMERLKADATDNTSLAEHLSETNFYLGKYYLSLGIWTAPRLCSNWRWPTTFITLLSTDTHCWNYRSGRDQDDWQNRTSNS